MNEHYYLYALTRSGCRADSLGAGVDPRFPVEIVPCKQIAGVASRVGLDQFNIRKLERENTDVNWLSQVAMRHNQVISDAARRQPLLPLRLCILFQSRLSLLAKMEHWESAVIDFLVPVPTGLQGIKLKFSIGIRDGAELPNDRFIAFRVLVNGWKLWSTVKNTHVWEDHEVELPQLGSDVARIEFVTDGLGDNRWNWAVWGEPRLEGDNR